MATVFPQALGQPQGYVDPYAQQIAAARARLQQPVAPTMTPEQQADAQWANQRDYQLGLLGQLSGSETLGGVGANVFKQALAGRQKRVTDQGTFDPLTGQFDYHPEVKRGRLEQAVAALEDKSAQARARWESDREKAIERAQQWERDAALRRDLKSMGGGGGAAGQDFTRGTKLRTELTSRLQKVEGGVSHARTVQQLLADPSVTRDPTKQVSLIFAFGKLLDPESVVRESEYALIANARGLFDSLQQMIPALQTGAKLSPNQLASMQQITNSLLSSADGRAQILKDQYGGIADRYGIPREDVLPFAPQPNARPGAAATQGIDVGAALAARQQQQQPRKAPAGAPAQSPQTGNRRVQSDL